MTLKAIREYLKESLQTEQLKGKGLKFTLKTNGDLDLFGKKLYALYESGERVSLFTLLRSGMAGRLKKF